MAMKLYLGPLSVDADPSDEELIRLYIEACDILEEYPGNMDAGMMQKVLEHALECRRIPLPNPVRDSSRFKNRNTAA